MAVALVALFVGLGGTSIAAVIITSANIKNSTIRSLDLKNNEVRGIDVRNNTLSGIDVNESKLAKVPSAASADKATNADKATTADSATTAGSVNGARIAKINQTVAVAGAPVTIFDAGGLKIIMDCGAGTNINLIASTTVGGSTISAFGVGNNANDEAAPRDLFSNQTAQGNFNPAGSGGTTTFNIAAAGGDGIATTVLLNYHNPSGSIISGQLALDEASGCQAHGHITNS